MTEEEIPLDLGIKIGTKKEKLWTNMKERAQTSVENFEAEIIINKMIIEKADQIIKEEQGKEE